MKLNNHCKEADRLLVSIAEAKALLEKAQKKAQVEMNRVTAQFSPEINKISEWIKADEKALEKLVLKQRAAVMGDKDRADLPGGSLLLKTEKRVRRIKGMLAKLKKAGLKQAIKVTKESVNWDVVDKFNDDTLAALGAPREEKDHFSYELKNKG